jgi:putative transposase
MRLPLRYRAKSGRNITQWHTPDFCVLRQAGACFEEWQPVHALEALAGSMPYRSQRDGRGTALRAKPGPNLGDCAIRYARPPSIPRCLCRT